MLPPGTFAALKRNPNETVVIAIFAGSVAVIATGIAAWPIVVLAALCLAAFHVRMTKSEQHLEVMAQKRIDEAVEKTSSMKAQHRLRTLPRQPEQPDLPLERPQRRLTRGERDDKDQPR